MERYLKHIDRHRNTYISAFVTGASAKLLLLHCPDTHHHHQQHSSSFPSTVASRSSAAASASSSRQQQAPPSFNPTAPAVEDATRAFFLDVYDAWVKTVMSPFYHVDGEVLSPVFRGRVQAAAKKYL